MSTTELLEGKKPELITGVPDSIRQELGERAVCIDPQDIVDRINKQLAARPAGAGRPEVRVGGADGIITQRGE